MLGMRRASIALLPLSALLALSACGAPDAAAGGGDTATTATAEATADTAVAFVGVDVIPMTEGGDAVLRDRTVLVQAGRIERVGPVADVEVPADARRVEGGVLMPGLAEMHAHIPPEGGRDWMERVLFLYLANGITTVRGMLGQPAHLELRGAVERGELLGPRIYTSGPSINGNSIPSPDSARRAVRHQARDGYDFLKIHPGLTRAEYDAMAEEAKKVGIRWAGHVPADVGLHRALEAGQATIDHLDRYVDALVPEGAAPEADAGFFGYALLEDVDRSRIPEVVEATREAGTWNVPTQSLIERFLAPESAERMAERPEVRYMPEDVVDGWIEAKRQFASDPNHTPERARRFIELRRQLIDRLHEGGAKLLLGSDAPQVFQVPGFSLHDELRLMVEAGLTPHEALVTGTRNVAEYFGAHDEYGTVEEGKLADLVLLEASPLEDITNSSGIRGVMAQGRWLPAEEIDRRLEAIAAEEGR